MKKKKKITNADLIICWEYYKQLVMTVIIVDILVQIIEKLKED